MTSCRQGDVLIREVKEIPNGATRQKSQKIIVAQGTATGHAHVIDNKHAEAFTIDDTVFLSVSKDAAPVDCYICKKDGKKCFIPAYENEARVVASGFEITGREPVVGVVLTHQEHLHFLILPGMGKVVHQREYHPKEIRRVQD